MNRSDTDTLNRKLLLLFYKVQNYHPLSETFNAYKQSGWKFEIQNISRGYCDNEKKRIVIPLWSCNHRNSEHSIYYLAHELAHIGTDIDTPETPHGTQWRNEFLRLCPLHLRKFDLDYRLYYKSESKSSAPT